MKAATALVLASVALAGADESPRHAVLAVETRVPADKERQALMLEKAGVVVEASDIATLRQGDAVLAIAGRPVHNDDSLQDVVRASPPDTEVVLLVRRADTLEDETVTVKLGSREGPAWPGIEWTHVGSEGLKEALKEAKESGRRVLVGLSGSEAC